MATSAFTHSQLGDAALKGTVKKAFRTKLDAQEQVWKKMGFEEDTSDAPFEEFTSYTGIGPAPRKEELGQVAIDVPKQNYTMRLSFLEYGIMIPVSEAALRFIKRGKMGPGTFIKPAQMTAESIAATNEILASDVFGNSFSTDYTGMDGVSLVSTAHKLGRGGTASNKIGTVSFSQSSIEAALIQGDRMPDDVGLPIGTGGGKRKLIIPPEYRFEAKRILEGNMQSNTANNTINALKGEDLEPVVNRWLPSLTNWFVVNMNQEQGLHAIFETKPTMRDFGDDKVHVKYFQAYQMVGFGFGLNWRRVQGSDF